jgi:hypothetical protein
MLEAVPPLTPLSTAAVQGTHTSILGLQTTEAVAVTLWHSEKSPQHDYTERLEPQSEERTKKKQC